MRRVLLWSVVGACAALALAPAHSLALPGQLDISFGGDGTALTRLAGRYSHASDVAALADGGVIVAGTSTPRGATDRGKIVLQDYRADGSLDPGFGGGTGIVLTNVNGEDDSIAAVAIQPDGRIVAAATTWLRRDDESAMVVVRYLPDGSLDRSFGGGDGIRLIRDKGLCGLWAADVALGTDGAIVVAGDAGCGGESDEGLHVAVARLTTDGRLDHSFSRDGLWTSWTGCQLATVALAGDGSIVVAGQAGYHDYCGGPMYAARLRRDGSFDPAFGRRGRAYVDFPGADSAFAFDMAFDREGRIVLAGSADNSEDYADDLSRSGLALVRLLPNGQPDRSFGVDGRSVTRLQPEPISMAYGLALAPDDTITVVGSARSKSDRRSRFIVARYQPSGVPDISFGIAGIQTVHFGGTREVAFGIALDQTGALVAAGESEGAYGDSIAVARLLAR
jgi:uncharacterized delta-60 repeat protein